MTGQKRMREAEPLWRYGELGEYVGLSVGTIPYIRVKGGRSIRFRRSDIDVWLGLSTHRRASGDSPAV
jgi:predicted DNA-binding transcriptional regulator AlpA